MTNPTYQAVVYRNGTIDASIFHERLDNVDDWARELIRKYDCATHVVIRVHESDPYEVRPLRGYRIVEAGISLATPQYNQVTMRYEFPRDFPVVR